jgi:biopolymer transport protein ExbD
MGLKNRPRGDGLAEPDLNSLVDIAFCLLLFFLLATTFLKTAGGKMEIPSGANSPQQSKSLAINLSADGIRWGEKAQQVQFEELLGLLVAEKLPGRPEAERLVVLDSKGDVPFETYFKVVMAIRQTGGILTLVDGDGGDKGGSGGGGGAP